MPYSIYNKSSEDMSEIESGSVSLIVASPPYNIGTRYGDNVDRQSLGDYEKMLGSVFAECLRVLKSDGKMVIEAADTLLIDGEYVQLAGMIQNICLELGFFLVERHINFVDSDNGAMLLDHGWEGNFTTTVNSHSNCHQWLVFSKTKEDFQNGQIYYFNYQESEDHPCAFPDKTCETILNKYFNDGDVVLDPFMGTATLGAHVINRGGDYKGFEIDGKIFSIAEKNLKQ